VPTAFDLLSSSRHVNKEASGISSENSSEDKERVSEFAARKHMDHLAPVDHGSDCESSTQSSTVLVSESSGTEEWSGSDGFLSSTSSSDSAESLSGSDLLSSVEPKSSSTFHHNNNLLLQSISRSFWLRSFSDRKTLPGQYLERK
jgi:hypothetical protein